MTSADEVSLNLMLDLLYGFIHGIAVQGANNAFRGVHHGNFDVVDLVRVGVEALTVKFREIDAVSAEKRK